MLKRNLIILTVLSLFVSCETDDVKPALLELTTTSSNLSENSGEIHITASINSKATTQITIPLSTSGTATQGIDYSFSSAAIIIPKGENTGSITISAIQDESVERSETIIISMGLSPDLIQLNPSVLTINLQDDDSDTDGDGVLDANDKCPDVPGDVDNEGCPYLGFLLNEIFYDPASGALGDANGDGVRDANEDEFIEFFNSGPDIDLSGYKIYDTTGLQDGIPRHIFPAGSIVHSNKAIVVFGGGTPTGTFGGAVVQTASSGVLNFTNSGDIITLQDPSGNTILTYDIEPLSDNPDESYTRNPDLTGDLIQHSSVPEANGKLFSPGTKIDASSF